MLADTEWTTAKNEMVEITFTSDKIYSNPFFEVDLSVEVLRPDNSTIIVPAFWAGENIWRFRYSSAQFGNHQYKTVCSRENDKGLVNKSGTIEVCAYDGSNPLYNHGKLVVYEGEKVFRYADGTPFLWLGDTWWFGFSKRFEWPEDFKELTADRKMKGFSVIQIIAGLYPDFNDLHPMGENEGGYPWTDGFETINPEYFNYADIKLMHLVENGLVPCVFGAWGYYISVLGVEKMKKHWEYIIARWGALPVIWSAAGEAMLPWYPDKDDTGKQNDQKNGWNNILTYIREKDSFENPLTIHPSPGDGSYSSLDIAEDTSFIDFDMLQTGHLEHDVLDITLNELEKSLNRKQNLPVLNGEVCYEGICGTHWQEVQRFLFWTHMLKGAAGHTYGAQGIWTFNGEGKNKFSGGKTGSWGDITWREAAKLKGSQHLGTAKKILEQFEWYSFEFHPEWLQQLQSHTDQDFRFAAGIPGNIRLYYFPSVYFFKHPFMLKKIILVNLERDRAYEARYINPRTGEFLSCFEIKADKNGSWISDEGFITANPTMEDWILVVKNI